jgi:hypothetical protein
MNRFAKVSLIAVLSTFVALAFVVQGGKSFALAQTPALTPPVTATVPPEKTLPPTLITQPPALTLTVPATTTLTATAPATLTVTGTVAAGSPAPASATATAGVRNTTAPGGSFNCPVAGVTSIMEGGMSGTMAPTTSATVDATMAATMQMGAAHDLARLNVQATAVPAATLTPDAQANAIYSGLLQARNCTYATTLTGAQEVPGPGDNDAIGTAFVSLDPATNQVCYAISADKITYPATAAHIHKGAAGVSGPVVVPFTNAPQAIGSIQVGCVTADPTVLSDIAANPSGYYVNIHTSDYPDGALRGQLFGAVRLTGAQEVPGPGAQGGIGLAGVSVNTATNTVCYSIYVRSITLPATAAHIHKGEVGVAGPVVVGFKTAPDGSGRAGGCVENVDAALVKDIAANPAGYYVNVHNADFPNGAVRGQLNGVTATTP